jgi:hypothetical protein
MLRRVLYRYGSKDQAIDALIQGFDDLPPDRTKADDGDAP